MMVCRLGVVGWCCVRVGQGLCKRGSSRLVRADGRKVESARKASSPTMAGRGTFELREALHWTVPTTLGSALVDIRIGQAKCAVDAHSGRTSKVVALRIGVGLRATVAVGRSEQRFAVLAELAEPRLLTSTRHPCGLFFGRGTAEAACALAEQRLGIIGAGREQRRLDDARDIAAVSGSMTVVVVDAWFAASVWCGGYLEVRLVLALNAHPPSVQT